MDKEYGDDYITITDDAGHEFELEHLDTMEYRGQTYMVFTEAGRAEGEEEYGIILFKVVEEDGEEVLVSIDDLAEEEDVYATYMERLFDEDEA